MMYNFIPCRMHTAFEGNTFLNNVKYYDLVEK